MDGLQTYTQTLATHNHHRLALGVCSDKLGMSRKGEVLALCHLLIYRSGNQSRQLALLQIDNSSLQSLDSRSTSLLRRLARLNDRRRATLHKIDLTTTCLTCRAHDIELNTTTLLIKGGSIVFRYRL